jgi:signal transduction histidine kinase
MTSLSRLGFAGRMILIMLMVIVPGSLVALFGTWAARSRDAGTGFRVPLPDQVAAIVDLLDTTTPERRSLVLRALNAPEVRVAIEPEAPPAPQTSVRLVSFEWLVNQYTAVLGNRRASVRLLPPEGRGVLGIVDWGGIRNAGRVQIVVPSGHEHIVIELREPTFIRLFGLPTGFWVGFLGVGLAGLAIVAILRESRPLSELSHSITHFARLAEPRTVAVRGAPDVRALIDAFNTMQGRIAGLVKGRTILLGAISHDLKTYITRLRLRVEDLPDAQSRDKAVADLDDMASLIENSISLARGEADRHGHVPVDIVAILEREVRARDGCSISLSVAAGAVVMLGDEVSLRRLFANVIDNALRYGTRAEISVSEAHKQLSIDIDDDGPGIPLEERDAVVEPFYRIEGSRNRDTGGSGLGLAIAQQVVAAHSGSLSITSSPLGGARVTLTFPFRQSIDHTGEEGSAR